MPRPPGFLSMNVNQITLSSTTRVEGKTDALHILSNQFQLEQYVNRFGNVEVILDAENNVYRVHSFAALRREYERKKSRDCEKWGSE